jgi:hypothetical protein
MSFFSRLSKRRGCKDDVDARNTRSEGQYGTEGPLITAQLGIGDPASPHNFPNPLSGRRMPDQQKHLKRLWDLSNQLIHTQLYNSEGSIQSGTLFFASADENEKTTCITKNHAFAFQKIEPWMEALSSHPGAEQSRDSLTGVTSFCTSFQVCFLRHICGADGFPKLWSEADASTPAVSNLAGQSPSIPRIPHEISFTYLESTRRHQLPEELAIPEHRSSFMKQVRNLALVGRGTRLGTKVNLYIEQPKPLQHINSVDDSTITWPNEYRGDIA